MSTPVASIRRMTSLAPLQRPNASVAAAQTEPRAQPVLPDAAERRGPFRPNRLAPVRERLSGRLACRLFQVGDLAAVAALAATFTLDTPSRAPVFVGSGLAVLAALGLLGNYRFGRREGLAFHLARLAASFALGLVAAWIVLVATAPRAFAGAGAGLWAAAALTTLYLLHALWWGSVRRWRIMGRLTPNIVVVGATGAAERLIAALKESRETNVLGVFDDRAARAPGDLQGVPVLGNTAALLDHRIMPYVDRVVITVPPRARARVRQLIARLRVLPNQITLLLADGAGPVDTEAVSRIADVPLAHISGPPTDHARALAKRAQDLVIGILALLVAAPVMLAIAIAVRLDSPGPVLFRQRRHGFNNEEIVVWKFRSMRVADQDLTASRQVSAEDARVTRVGRFIRRTSLDELPQLLNVLKGEMSLVGPRPHAVGMMTGDVESARLVDEYAHRHRMKPGMTGYAAIHGSRGPVDTPASVRRRVALDVEYIERQSFWLDLWIMLMTLPCLLGDAEAVR